MGSLGAPKRQRTRSRARRGGLEHGRSSAQRHHWKRANVSWVSPRGARTRVLTTEGSLEPSIGRFERGLVQGGVGCGLAPDQPPSGVALNLNTSAPDVSPVSSENKAASLRGLGPQMQVVLTSRQVYALLRAGELSCRELDSHRRGDVSWTTPSMSLATCTAGVTAEGGGRRKCLHSRRRRNGYRLWHQLWLARMGFHRAGRFGRTTQRLAADNRLEGAALRAAQPLPIEPDSRKTRQANLLLTPAHGTNPRLLGACNSGSSFRVW